MKKYLKRIIIIICGIGFFLLLLVIRNNQVLADFYVKNISSNYIRVIGTIFSIIPFSLYEFMITGLVIYLLVSLIRLFIHLFKRRWNELLNHFLSLLCAVIICLDWYFAIASVSYGRSPVDIPQYEGEITPQIIEEGLHYYVEDFNEISKSLKRDNDNKIIMPYSYNDLNRSLRKEFEKLSNNSSYFSTYTPRVKKLTFSPIFSELHITGVSWAITGESSINAQIAPCELPFVMAHEIAHLKGVYRENDANLVALYICINSEDDYLRYSGYHSGIYALMDAYNTTFSKSYAEKYPLSRDIYLEYNSVNEFWNNHDLLKKIGEFYNDLFLKINGNSDGINDYTDTSEKEDTGKVDESGNKIYIITNFSPYQKLFYYLFLNK